MHHVARVAMVVVVGCSASSGTSPTPASTSTSSKAPAVHQAWIAYELSAVTGAHTPAEHAALPSTTFVALKRSASPPPDAKSVTFIVARDATFDVFEIGRHTPPLAFTTFDASHAACVGRGARRVALKFEKPAAGLAIEESVVLEGCPPPPNTYGTVVVEGAHPGAILVESPKGRLVRLASGIELPVPDAGE